MQQRCFVHFAYSSYSGVAPDSMCLGEAASPRMPRGRSGSADSSSGLGRFGGAGLDHPVELSVES